jgi:anti-sigma B factor antagonist
MSLRAEVGHVSATPVVTLAGRVDLATVATLQASLARTIGDHPGVVIAIDLDGVDALDDVGLGVILGAAGRARRAGGDLVIVCRGAPLLERLAVCHLDRAVTVVPSIAAIGSATDDR